jgi:hypothetical protein
MDEYKKRRLKDIRSILKYYKEPLIPNEILQKIYKKFPIVSYYNLLKVNEIKEGDILCLVTLDLKKKLIRGVCIKINYAYNNDNVIENIKLVNNYKNIVWYVNPTKYYVFSSIDDTQVQFKVMYERYKANKELFKDDE